jgi:hypothetical protein
MICAPVFATSSGSNPFTEPFVPTGMNAGVSNQPCGVETRPTRAWHKDERALTSNDSGLGTMGT